MSRDKIFNEVQEIFRDIFDDENMKITLEMTPSDIEEWDSFEQINILLSLEESLGIKINTDDIEGIRNVGDIVEVAFKCMNK